MGAAAYQRGSNHIRQQIDVFLREGQSERDREAWCEHAQRLTLEVETLRAQLAETKRALMDEISAHQQTIANAKDAAASVYAHLASLTRSYSDVSEKLLKVRPLTRYEAMLLIDDVFTLVHPAAGGLASFATIDEARKWAARHDGYIPQQKDYHDFHGVYYRVGFNIWPEKA